MSLPIPEREICALARPAHVSRARPLYDWLPVGQQGICFGSLCAWPTALECLRLWLKSSHYNLVMLQKSVSVVLVVIGKDGVLTMCGG
jgi:hypothetical protein